MLKAILVTDSDLLQHRVTSYFTMTTQIRVQSVVMPQTGRHTSSNGLTFFGSEVARLTGELLADTTQTVPDIRIT